MKKQLLIGIMFLYFSFFVIPIQATETDTFTVPGHEIADNWTNPGLVWRNFTLTLGQELNLTAATSGATGTQTGKIFVGLYDQTNYYLIQNGSTEAVKLAGTTDGVTSFTINYVATSGGKYYLVVINQNIDSSTSKYEPISVTLTWDITDAVESGISGYGLLTFMITMGFISTVLIIFKRKQLLKSY